MSTDMYGLIQQSRVLQERALEEAEQARRGGPLEAAHPLWGRLATRLHRALLRRRASPDRVGIAECLLMLAGVTAGRIKAGAGGQGAAAAQGAEGSVAPSPGPSEEAESGGQRVARLLGAAETLLETTGADWEPRARIVYDRATAVGQELLGEQAFEAARREGRAMPLDEAIAYALEGAEEQTGG